MGGGGGGSGQGWAGFEPRIEDIVQFKQKKQQGGGVDIKTVTIAHTRQKLGA